MAGLSVLGQREMRVTWKVPFLEETEIPKIQGEECGEVYDIWSWYFRAEPDFKDDLL